MKNIINLKKYNQYGNFFIYSWIIMVLILTTYTIYRILNPEISLPFSSTTLSLSNLFLIILNNLTVQFAIVFVSLVLITTFYRKINLIFIILVSSICTTFFEFFLYMNYNNSYSMTPLILTNYEIITLELMYFISFLIAKSISKVK